MGYLYLLLAKIAAIIKMISVKQCGNIAAGTRNSVIINLIRSLGCLAVSLLVCAFSGFEKMDTAGIWISVLSGISNGLLLCTWILAANKAPLCTVEVFCMTGGVVLPLIISPFLLSGDTVSLIQWIGSALLFIAMFCLSKENEKKRLLIGDFAILVICGLSNFGCVITQKLYTAFSQSSVADFQLFTFLFTCVTLLLILIFYPKRVKEKSPKFNIKTSSYILVAIITLYIGQFLTTLASDYLPSAVFYPLSYVISMPLVFLVDIFLYKEKITLSNVLGIIFVTVSGILINI